MDKKQPPDPGNRNLDTSTTDDKINAFDEVADSFCAGIQPAVFLSHSFLQKHPILLEEGCLLVNWDRIPGLYRRTNKLLTVSVTDKQWEKWGQSRGWTAWEPDTEPQNFFPNMAMVVSKGAFYDAQDPQMQTKVGHFISIARVPDCVWLLPFEELREAFNNYADTATAIGLVQLHRGNALFPDVYFQFYGEHFTIMGLQDPTIQFGTADEFVGGYLVRQHVTASGRKAHAMLPPGYVRGATCPVASPTYPYRPCGTGVPGEQPPVHIVYMAALGTVLSSPQRFCLGEAPASQWPFNGVPVPWILLEGYRNPDGAAPDFPGNDNQAEDSNGKGSGRAPGGPSAKSENNKEDDDDEGFETVDDGDEDTGSKVVVKISMKDVAKPEGSGLTGTDRLFDSDDEEDDAELKEQIETAYKTADTIDELKLSETSSSSNSGSSDSDDDPNETKQYPEHPEAEGVGESGFPGPGQVDHHLPAGHEPRGERVDTGSACSLDRVREAGIALSRQVTSLTTDHKQSSASGEIFQRLLPAYFEWVWVRTEATFSTLNASLPTLLCRFVSLDQAGQIFSSIFTCMCNYNTEICGMAMAQTVVPVYTIPNTYRVQQSLWESLC